MSAASNRVRLNPSELYELKWITGGLLTLLSVWTLVYIDLTYIPLVLSVVGVVGVAMIWPALPGRIPPGLWKLTTPLLIVGVLIDFFLSRPDVLPPLIRMIVFLAVLRSLSYRRRREDLQLVLLCLFMVVVSGVLSVSLAFAFQILLFTPVAMMLLFLVTITGCTERPEEILADSWKNFQWKRFIARLRSAFDWRLIGFIGVLFLALVAMSSGIFMLMPRFRLDQAIPFFKLQSKRSLSGFSDNIQFGDVTDIMEDDAVAFRVDLSEGAERPDIPYWRMVVLDEYTGEGFRMSLSARSQNRLYSDNHFGNPSLEWVSNNSAGRWTFYYEGGISKFLPSIGLSRGLRFQNRQTIEYNPLLDLTGLNTITSSVTFYQLEEIDLKDSLPGKPDDLKLVNAKPVTYLPRNSTAPTTLKYPFTTIAIPTGEVNQSLLARIVAEVTEGRTDLHPLAFGDRLIHWLHQRHAYSLQSEVPGGEGDRLLRWAVSNEPGHCELFAGSFAIIARAAGYPTRMVTGFVGGGWNGYENYYMIRNRDAHAWLELFDSASGSWNRIDPTPGSRITDLMNLAGTTGGGRLFIDRTIGAYFDSLRVLWYRSIVNFDQEQQQELATGFRAWANTLSTIIKDQINEWKKEVEEFFKAPWDRQRWLELGSIVAILVAAVLLAKWLYWFYQWYRRRKHGARSDTVWNPQRRKAGTLVHKFRQRGLDERPEAAAIYSDLLTIRFGKESSWPQAKPTFREARRKLRSLK